MPFPGWPRSLTCDSNDLQVSTPARSHCRLLRFSIMICPNRSSMFTWERKGEAGHCQKGFSGSRICKIRQHHSISNQPWLTSANTQGRSWNRVQAQHGGLTRAYTPTAPRRATGHGLCLAREAAMPLPARCSVALMHACKGARMFTAALRITERAREGFKCPSFGVKEILAWSFNGILHCHENRKRRGYTCR